MPSSGSYRFGRHAKNRMRWLRGTPDELSEADAIAVVEHPDAVTPTEKGRLNAWKAVSDGWIRVTFRQAGAQTIIVTVTVKDRGPTPEEMQP